MSLSAPTYEKKKRTEIKKKSIEHTTLLLHGWYRQMNWNSGSIDWNGRSRTAMGREKVGADGEVSLTNAGVMRWRRDEAGKSILARVFRALICNLLWTILCLFFSSTYFLLHSISCLRRDLVSSRPRLNFFLACLIFPARFCLVDLLVLATREFRCCSHSPVIFLAVDRHQFLAIIIHCRDSFVVSRAFSFIFLASGWKLILRGYQLPFIHFAPLRPRSSLFSVYWERGEIVIVNYH